MRAEGEGGRPLGLVVPDVQPAERATARGRPEHGSFRSEVSAPLLRARDASLVVVPPAPGRRGVDLDAELEDTPGAEDPANPAAPQNARHDDDGREAHDCEHEDGRRAHFGTTRRFGRKERFCGFSASLRF